MKSIQLALILCCAFSFSPTVILCQNQSGQDSTGLPGDQFSLQGALHLFSQSASPEDFEMQLNSESSNVNNLDLNENGDIDYVRVIDQTDGDVHAFILQVPVSETENQDIAVIELEKTGKESAIIQIVGDEDIYGEQVIVEPSGEEASSQGNKGGASMQELEAIVVNVWLWPSVRFVYAPAYRPWVSPWRWHYYPAWWRPWRPLRWHVWHPYHHRYHGTFTIVHTHRVVRAHRVYTPYRTTSVTVHRRHSASIGHYKVTRTKATFTGPRGKTTSVKRTTVTGPRGNKATRTTVRRKN